MNVPTRITVENERREVPNRRTGPVALSRRKGCPGSDAG